MIDAFHEGKAAGNQKNVVGFSGPWRRLQGQKFQELDEATMQFHKDMAKASKDIKKQERKDYRKAMKQHVACCQALLPPRPMLPLCDIAAPAPVVDGVSALVPYETVAPMTCQFCAEDGRPQQAWHPPMHPLPGMRAPILENGSLAIAPYLPLRVDAAGNAADVAIVPVTVDVHRKMLQRTYCSCPLG